jgi:hypothetical protein
MWQEHIQQILRIISLRHQTKGVEPHAFIIWFVSIVDTYALLSTAGTGKFVESILKNSMMPAPKECLAPLTPSAPQVFYPEEEGLFPALLQLNQEVLLAAIHVGEMARDMRSEAILHQSSEPLPHTKERIYASNRQQRLQELQTQLRNSYATWSTQYPNTWTHVINGTILPARVQGVCEHVSRMAFISFRPCY